MPPGASFGASVGVLVNSRNPRRISSDRRELSSVLSVSGFRGNSHPAFIDTVAAMSGPVIGNRGVATVAVAGFSAGRAQAAASSNAMAIALTKWRLMTSCPTIAPIMLKRYALVVALALAIGGATLAAQTVTKESLPGVTNFAKLDTTIACAGATTPAALAGLKQMGYASVINLREASEAGADVDAEAAAAKAAGINFIHLPFNTAMPDPAVADRFLVAVTDKKNQ